CCACWNKWSRAKHFGWLGRKPRAAFVVASKGYSIGQRLAVTAQAKIRRGGKAISTRYCPCNRRPLASNTCLPCPMKHYRILWRTYVVGAQLPPDALNSRS